MLTHTRAHGRGLVRALSTACLAGLAVAGAAPSAAPAPTAADSLRASARQHVLAGGQVRVVGALDPGQAGRKVLVQVSAGDGWRTVARARTGDGGRFAARWTPKGVGRYGVRVRTANGSAKRIVRGGVTVYRRSAASWYGPGFYGRRTACGRTLTRGTLGVANKSLPCGTRVTLRYRGRTVVAPVIDRGPYAGGREYDLTAETKERLGFGSTGTVWSSPRGS